MPTIRIDEDVFRALQSHARPFIDTPNDVLRRVLGLDRSHAQGEPAVKSRIDDAKAGRKRHLDRTPESEFRLPVLQALIAMGGRGAVGDVLQRVERALTDRLRPDDFGKLAKSGEIRWENTAKWARKRMVDKGLLNPNSPHGFWEITEARRRSAARPDA